MLLADGGVVQGNISHPPFPSKQVARLAVYVEGLVNGLPCIIVITITIIVMITILITMMMIMMMISVIITRIVMIGKHPLSSS